MQASSWVRTVEAAVELGQQGAPSLLGRLLGEYWLAEHVVTVTVTQVTNVRYQRRNVEAQFRYFWRTPRH